jgi:hypothetical protein
MRQFENSIKIENLLMQRDAWAFLFLKLSSIRTIVTRIYNIRGD